MIELFEIRIIWHDIYWINLSRVMKLEPGSSQVWTKIWYSFHFSRL